MKFEYLVLDARLGERKNADIERDLNDLGNEGWELVATFGLYSQLFVMQRVIAGPGPAPRVKAKKQS